MDIGPSWRDIPQVCGVGRIFGSCADNVTACRNMYLLLSESKRVILIFLHMLKTGG